MLCCGRRLVALDDRIGGLHGLFVPALCVRFFLRVQPGLCFCNGCLAWLYMDLPD